jgi:hypothetical protein
MRCTVDAAERVCSIQPLVVTIEVPEKVDGNWACILGYDPISLQLPATVFEFRQRLVERVMVEIWTTIQ